MDRVRFIDNRFDVAVRDVFASERWKPVDYWQAEDRVWTGEVLAHPPERADTGEPESPRD